MRLGNGAAERCGGSSTLTVGAYNGDANHRKTLSSQRESQRETVRSSGRFVGEACQGNRVGLKVGLNVAKMGDGVMVSGGRHIVVSF